MRITNQMCLDRILVKMGRTNYKQEVNMHSCYTAEDYGPQRFCRHCSCKLEERYESMDSTPIWVHPNTECHIIDVVNNEDMTSGIMNHDNLEMDDLRNIYRKVLRTEWYKKNKEIIKKIYVDHADFAGVDSEIECCRFKEEVNDDEGNVVTKETESTDLDVGIADEEKTHIDKEHLKFWRLMTWMIGHCPDRAYDLAINHLHTGFLNEDEVDWIATITNGMRNNGKFRYVQYLMMAARKCLKNNPLKWIPEPPKKFDNVQIRKEASYKYPGKNMWRISFDYYGSYTTISKIDGCTNWLNPSNISIDDLNGVLDIARKQYKK
jgi:hypothetical protein